MYIEGAISSQVEDVEGNQFDPTEFDTSRFLSEGFLDVDHLMHNNGIQESVIGKPVSVWTSGKRLFARFLLYPSAFTREIYDYIQTHPGVLGFSVAGWVDKPYFGRGGKWDLISCALTHSPKQPDAYAVALSASGMTLRGVMSAFIADLKHGSVDVSGMRPLYLYFRGMADSPVLALELAAWSYQQIHGGLRYNASFSATDTISQMRENLFFRESDVESFTLDTKAELAHWRFLHPEDEHIAPDGRLKSLEDAVAHLRYCMRLNPIQVATILGRLRGREDVIKGISKTHGAA